LDKTQIEHAYSTLKQNLIKYLQSRLDDPSIAEDIIHDAFIKALMQDRKVELNTSMGIQNVNAWLYAIVKNVLTDHYRYSAKFPRTEISKIVNERVEEEDDFEAHALFSTCLRPFAESLDNKYSQVLILKDFEGLTIAEIAKRKSLSVSAVKSRLVRSRQQLKSALVNCCDIETSSGIVKDFKIKKTKNED